MADVGWNSREELDLITVGGKASAGPAMRGSYGPRLEGQAECAAEYAKEGTANAHVRPIYWYSHNYALHPSWAAIAGPEYTGAPYPAGYRGTHLLGRSRVGFMKRLTLTAGGQVASMADFIGADWHGVDLMARRGDIAWVDLGGWQTNAAFVDRLVYSATNQKPNAVAAATPTTGTAPLAVSFDGFGSTDRTRTRSPTAGTSATARRPGRARSPSTPTPPPAPTSRPYGLRRPGQTDTDTVEINASNTPPVPVIEIPSATFEYRNGVPVSVRGSASDAEQGTLPASAFDWSVRIVHHDHEHLLGTPGRHPVLVRPLRDHDSDSFYRIRLTVTDAGGAIRSVEREIQPETVPLHLRSVPTGAPLSYAGKPATAPFDIDTTIGFIGTISAPATYTSGGVQRNFLSWSNGAARVHDFTVPASETTLTATYNGNPVAAASASPTSGPVPLTVAFDASASSDPDGDPHLQLELRRRHGRRLGREAVPHILSGGVVHRDRDRLDGRAGRRRRTSRSRPATPRRRPGGRRCSLRRGRRWVRVMRRCARVWWRPGSR